jgi:hypothetical protein
MKEEFIDVILSQNPNFDFSKLDFLVLDTKEKILQFAEKYAMPFTFSHVELLERLVDIIKVDPEFDFSVFEKIDKYKRNQLP